MSATPLELKQQLEDSIRELVETLYQEEDIQVDEFLYDPLWKKEGQKITGRFRGKDNNTYIFVKDAGELRLFQTQD